MLGDYSSVEIEASFHYCPVEVVANRQRMPRKTKLWRFLSCIDFNSANEQHRAFLRKFVGNDLTQRPRRFHKKIASLWNPKNAGKNNKFGDQFNPPLFDRYCYLAKYIHV